MDIQRAINHLVQYYGLELPHGIMPGSFPAEQTQTSPKLNGTLYRWKSARA